MSNLPWEFLIVSGVVLIAIIANKGIPHLSSVTTSWRKLVYIALGVIFLAGLAYGVYRDWIGLPPLTRENVLLGLGLLAMSFFALVMLGTKWGREMIAALVFIVGATLAVVTVIMFFIWPEHLGLEEDPELSGFMGGYHTLEYGVTLEIAMQPGERRHFDKRSGIGWCVMFIAPDWNNIRSWYQDGRTDGGNTYIVHNVSDQTIHVLFRKIEVGEVWQGMLCQ